MSVRALTNCKLWVDGWDLSGDFNAITLNTGVREVDGQVFGFDTEKKLPGLRFAQLEGGGLFRSDVDLLDEVLFGRLGLADTVYTVVAETGAEGEASYSSRMMTGEYAPIAAGKVGDALRFRVKGSTTDRFVRGTLMHNATEGTSGQHGTIFTFPGGIASGKTMYAALHMLALTGGITATIKIQSSAASDLSSPTDRITFAGMTAKGSQWGVKAGAVVQDYWAVQWGFSGAGTAQFIVTAGIY
jgi:hypothetical protein